MRNKSFVPSSKNVSISYPDPRMSRDACWHTCKSAHIATCYWIGIDCKCIWSKKNGFKYLFISMIYIIYIYCHSRLYIYISMKLTLHYKSENENPLKKDFLPREDSYLVCHYLQSTFILKWNKWPAGAYLVYKSLITDYCYKDNAQYLQLGM